MPWISTIIKEYQGPLLTCGKGFFNASKLEATVDITVDG
jgi:hypothetical protein